MTQSADGRPSLTLTVVGIGTFLTALAGSSVSLALPFIAKETNSSMNETSWVMSSFMLSTTVFLLAAGRASDIFGHRIIYLAGFGIFGAASLGCGFAPDYFWLIVMRSAQGVGGAMIMSSGPAMLTGAFPDSQRGKALGILSTSTYLGLSFGPPLGGLFIQTLGWRWIFYINAPITALVLALGLLFSAKQTVKPDARFDYQGFVFLTLGLPPLLIALGQTRVWGVASAQTAAWAGAGAVGLALFVRSQIKSDSPLLDAGLFRSPVFSSAVLSALCNYAALFIQGVLAPFYLVDEAGLGAAQAGLVLTAQPAMMALCASPSGYLSDKIGARWLAAGGMTVLAAGLAFLSFINSPADWTTAALSLAIIGVGTGVFISPNSSALMGSAPKERQGTAGSLMAVSRNLGMLLGVSAATAIFKSQGSSGSKWTPTEYSSFKTAMIAAACLALIGAAAAALPKTGARKP